MPAVFRDRLEAGRLLARELMGYAGQPGVLILALPRGGVPVAAEVARALHVLLDVFVVRKLGTPAQPELAMGAIATGGVRVLNDEVVEKLRIPVHVIDEVAAEEEKELQRRTTAYRGNQPPPVITGKTTILVDDGVATGSTMLAAIRAIRAQHPARLVVATPTAAAATLQQLRLMVDECVAVIAPEFFGGVGEWYEDFSQTSDEEVTGILRQPRTEN